MVSSLRITTTVLYVFHNRLIGKVPPGNQPETDAGAPNEYCVDLDCPILPARPIFDRKNPPWPVDCLLFRPNARLLAVTRKPTSCLLPEFLASQPQTQKKRTLSAGCAGDTPGHAAQKSRICLLWQILLAPFYLVSEEKLKESRKSISPCDHLRATTRHLCVRLRWPSHGHS